MAIFNMSDSSINEYYLNEHGGAHRKYGEILEKKSKDHMQKARDAGYRAIAMKDLASQTHGKAKEKAMDSYEENLERSKNHLKKSDRLMDDSVYFGHGLQKELFRQRTSGKSKDTINTNDRKPGTYLKAQKELREAAEYILSVLDEMDYIEEAKKTNNQKIMIKQIKNDALKDIVKDAIKDRLRKGKVVDLNTIPDSDEDK